jgi:EAL domain-containing protein (putative c-di-GMP-specific phosphodiesterase class I)
MHQLRAWQQRFPSSLRLFVSVNMSVTDLSDPGLFETISGLVREAEIDPVDLVIEITESVLLDDAEQTIHFLGQLKDLGVGLALDDFGTAFSSLSYVRRFPFDRLKLDISFTSELPQSTRSMLLVEEICHLATSMGMKSIAEGIERQEQADALRDIGCFCGQGYLFSRPLSASGCTGLLKARHASLADHDRAALSAEQTSPQSRRAAAKSALAANRATHPPAPSPIHK